MGALLLAGAAFWLYAPALHGGWLWDDREDLPDNPVLKAAHPLRLIWTGSGTWDYYPIKSTLQWLQWNAWGDHTLGYHVTNVLLHVLSALLIWRLLGRLGLRVGWAWCGALLFLVHPVAVGSVAWITEFKDCLALPLLLLSALWYLDFGGARPPGALDALATTNAVRPSAPGGRAPPSLALVYAWLWYLAAMLAKSSVMMFPLCLLLYGWWARRPLRRLVLSSLPFFAVSAVCGWIALQLQIHRSTASDGSGLGGALFRFSFAAKALAFYFRQAVAPHTVTPVYDRWAVGGYGWWLPCIAILAVCLGQREAWGRAALLGLGWFALQLIPVLGVVGISFMRFTWVMDHLAYVALIGIAGLAAAGLQIVSTRAGLAGRIGAIAAAVAAAIALTRESRAYVPAYASEESLWTYAALHQPEQWTALGNLAAVRVNQGRLEEGLALLNHAARLNPNAPETHRTLGLAQDRLGRFEPAIAEARRALELRPDFRLAALDLGIYLIQAGRPAEAVPVWQAALKTRPDDPDLLNHYGFTLLILGRRDEGMALIRRALAIDPQWGPAELNLGLALMEGGQNAAAVPHLEAAARLLPDNAIVRQRLREARQQP